MVTENFCSDKKLGPFSLRNQVFRHFLRNRISDFYKTWSETGDNCLESWNDSFVPGKFLFWPFWPFLGQKYFACGDIYMVLGCFWSFFSKPLVFLLNFCYLNYVYGLGMIIEKLSFNKKFGPHEAI